MDSCPLSGTAGGSTVNPVGKLGFRDKPSGTKEVIVPVKSFWLPEPFGKIVWVNQTVLVTQYYLLHVQYVLGTWLDTEDERVSKTDECYSRKLECLMVRMLQRALECLQMAHRTPQRLADA